MYGLMIKVLVTVGLLQASCAGLLAPRYEYEESMRLNLDGSGAVTVVASVPALAALRGLALGPDPSNAPEPVVLQRMYESPAVSAVRLGRSWRRDGRWFVQIHVEFDDVRALSEAAPFAWSAYDVVRVDEVYRFTQTVSRSDRPGATWPGWDGDERVAFRLDLPSRIFFHNAPSKRIERGNRLTWEQTLYERRDGAPLNIEVRMGTTSILRRTLALFGAAFFASLAVLGGLVWWMVRQGRRAPG